MAERQRFKSPNRRPNLINQALPDIEIKLGDDEREYETEIRISEIEMSPDQTRKAIDINDPNIVNLATNIEELGLFYPVIVRPHPDKGSPYKWQMIAGARRVTAFRRLGREMIPAKIRTKLTKDNKKAWATTLSENALREQLKPNEAAVAIDEGRARFGMSRTEIAAVMGITPEAVSRLHGTSKLPIELIIELEKYDKLKSRHIAAFRTVMGRAKLSEIRASETDTEQITEIKKNIHLLLQRIVAEDLNGDNAIEYAKEIVSPKKIKTVLTSFNMRLPDVIKRRPKNMSVEKRTLFISQGERMIAILQKAIAEEKEQLAGQTETGQQEPPEPPELFDGLKSFDELKQLSEQNPLEGLKQRAGENPPDESTPPETTY